MIPAMISKLSDLRNFTHSFTVFMYCEYMCLYMFSHVHLCVWGGVSASASTCTWKETKNWHQMPSLIHLHLCMNSKFTDLASLYLAPGIHCLLLPWESVTSMQLQSLSSCRVCMLSVWLCVPMLHIKHFSHRIISQTSCFSLCQMTWFFTEIHPGTFYWPLIFQKTISAIVCGKSLHS